MHYFKVLSNLLIFSFGITQIIIALSVIFFTLIIGELVGSWKQFLPLTYFFLPYILLIKYLPEFHSLNFILNLLILHVCVTIPLLIIDKYINKWLKKNLLIETENLRIFTIKSPNFYFDLAIGLLYPYIFGVILLSMRYLAMGKNIDMSFLFTDVTLRIGFLILCYLPLLIWCFLKFLKVYLFIRNYLWLKLKGIFYSIHLFLLNTWDNYFIVCSKLHKFLHFIHCYCTRISKTKWPKNPNKFWISIENLYLYPQICSFLIFLFICFEVALSQKIHFGLYLLFLLICIRSIFSNLYAFGQTLFCIDCCFANYLYKNYIYPRFPIPFWSFFNIANELYCFEHLFSKKEIEEIKFQQKLYSKKVNFFEKNYTFSHFKKIYNLPQYSFSKSIAYTYWFFFKIRFN